ncbi:MAG: hemagglutinin, partial [Bacteroidaceae bacterium]|nr:hemagglutinin [Bacteroidaceae bacterium]
ELERLRLRRVKLGQYIIKAVRAAQEFPHEEIACAGRALYPVLKPCVGFYRLPAVQVTVIIEAMLLDLGKEENAGHVKTLGLDAHVAELADVNARYSSLVASRTQTRAAAVPVTVRKLRDESDALYRYITTLAFCHSVCHPSEATARYIGRLNAIIDETKTAYRQRRAKSKPQ